MKAPSGGSPAAVERLLEIGFWVAPPALAVWFYWLGIRTWFLADDFAWLTHATEFSNFGEFLRTVFMPMAQGTIRPWSDRLFFIVLYHVFGLTALPFHICIFLTQCVNILLLLSIARRITGSRLAAFTTALFWIFNTSQPLLMTWASAYNEPLCALFILGAFHFLLRFLETGARRDWLWQWAIFLLGFGAMELNVVYPALAAAYTFLFARKHFPRTLPLFAPSIAYAIVHRLAAPTPSGAYVMHFGKPMLHTLLTFWKLTLGPASLADMLPLTDLLVATSSLLMTAGLLGSAAWGVWRGDRRPIFFLAWFLVLIAPVLPLSEHVTLYYPFLPAIGLAMLGGWAFARAWDRPHIWRPLAVGLSLMYFAFSTQAASRLVRWEYERGYTVRKVVTGVARAHELHPASAILLDGVDSELFWILMPDRPFPLVGATSVYLTPGAETRIQAKAGFGDPVDYLIPPGPTWHALMAGTAEVYSVREERLRNITNAYAVSMPPEWETMKPARVEASNPSEAYLLGPEWYALDYDHRWMPRRATVRIAGAKAPGAKLRLSGTAGPSATRVAASVDGVKLPDKPIVPKGYFDVEWDAPPSAVGKATVEVTIETDGAMTPPGDVRKLGLAFGVIEIR